MRHTHPLLQLRTAYAAHLARAQSVGIVLVACAATIATSPSATAATPPGAASAADRSFLQVASQGNRFEIASGDIAVQVTKRTRTTAAKKLATMAGMIASDHQKAEQRLATLAKSLDVNIPTQPDPVQQFLVSQLASYAAALNTGNASGSQSNTDPNKTNSGDMGSEGGKKGTNGDASTTPTTNTKSSAGTSLRTLRGFYLNVQAAVHEQAIQNYSTIAISTKNKGVRTYACQSLSVLRRHLVTVQRALGSARPKLAMSDAKVLTAKATRACAPSSTSG